MPTKSEMISTLGQVNSSLHSKIRALETKVKEMEQAVEVARQEFSALQKKQAAQQKYLERMVNRNRFQCAASGCDGCIICDPVKAMDGVL